MSYLPLRVLFVVAMLLPVTSHAESSFTDPFSPFNPNSFTAQNRERQQVALEKQRQTWWDRFKQRLNATWREPPGTRFFSRLFRPRVIASAEVVSRRWGADIFTRFRRTDRVAFNTTTTGTGQALFVDKVSRNALFDNTGSFGKQVQRAVADTRVGYWDARGGKLMARVAHKIRQLMRQGAHRMGWTTERRPDRPGGSVDASRRWKVQPHNGQMDRQRRMLEEQQRRRMMTTPVWRVRTR